MVRLFKLKVKSKKVKNLVESGKLRKNSGKIQLSVAIATYNEESNIGRCLDSVKGWVDEVVIVDGSSTDATVKIAKKYEAKIFVTTNKPIFHINKQMAIDKCQGGWILQLDADEIVSGELKKEIINVIEDKEPEGKIVAFYIPRRNYFLGKWLRKTGQYPDSVIRFFKKGKAKLPCRSVHEQMEVNGKVGYLKGHFLHYPYPSFSEYLKKSNRYTTLSAQELLNSGEKPGGRLFWKACWQFKKTFWLLFLRHKGFLDGFPGFVFSFYSGLHHITAYIKFWELYCQERQVNIKKDWE